MLSTHEKSAYKSSGFLRLGTVLTSHDIRALSDDIERLSVIPGDSTALESRGATARALHGCHKQSELLADLCRHQDLVGLAQDLLDDDVYVYQFKVNLKAAFCGERWPWHRDYDFWRSEDGMIAADVINLAILVDDATPSNGPMLVVPGSHMIQNFPEPKRSPMDSGWRRDVGSDLSYTVPLEEVADCARRSGVEALVGPAGSAFVFDSRIVHGSSENMSPFSRRMIIITYNSLRNAPRASELRRPEFLVERAPRALSALRLRPSFARVDTDFSTTPTSGSSIAALETVDPTLADLLQRERDRQSSTLTLVASCSVQHPSVAACEASVANNVTAEGYPKARFHAGCTVIDEIEQLAIDRACRVFHAQHANAQPLSASIANQAILAALVPVGGTILGLGLDAGGHLSHGSKANLSGKHYRSISYGLDACGRIDLDQVRDLAREYRPALVVVGTTAYPRAIDFSAFRAIADEVGALLLADITHIAGLVATGEHASPIDHAHIVTTCTHKQLFGPRGGLILLGQSADSKVVTGSSLASVVDRAIFPLLQGAPNNNMVAAKARILDFAQTAEFRSIVRRIRSYATTFAQQFEALGRRVVSGGTDNHIILIDTIESYGISGIVAQRALEQCNIVVNKNSIPNDPKNVRVASGMRIGTNSLALRNLQDPKLIECVETIDRLLRAVVPVSDTEFTLPDEVSAQTRSFVRDFCRSNPLAGDWATMTPVASNLPGRAKAAMFSE